jgi:hypothetical protein
MAAKPKKSTNAAALEKTLDSMYTAGLLEGVDAAHVQMLRSLAAACDTQPGKAALWREYREALGEVRAAGDDADDDLSGLLTQIGGAASVGDETQT